MSEYYGTSAASSDFLAHYGVKGMKWGVRKALAKNNAFKLAYHYDRALRKKASLKEQANPKEEKENAKAYAAGGGALLGAGALGGLASYGIAKGQVAAQKALFPNSKYVTIMHPVGLYGLSGLSAAGGLASLGAAAKSAYHTTKRGHKKAVNRYNNFTKEMNTQFNKKNRKIIAKYLNEHPEDRHDLAYAFNANKKRRK